jgi:hypothetical protein
LKLRNGAQENSKHAVQWGGGEYYLDSTRMQNTVLCAGVNMNTVVKDLLAQSKFNGGTVWDRHDGSIYNPIGFSTMEILSVLGDIGFDYEKEKIINEALKKVIGYYDNKAKQFKYSEKSSKLPCISAKIVATLQKLKYDFQYFEDCYQYFLDTQQKDGGWRCATVKLGKSPETDASNPGTTLYVLDAFRYRNNSEKDIIQLNNGIGFLLDHWITKKPLGPCEFGIGTTFLKTEYPFIRYNIFYYAYILSFYSKAIDDKRFKEILKILLDKETNTGIRIENPHKSWKDILYKNGLECDLANMKFFELKKNGSKC